MIARERVDYLVDEGSFSLDDSELRNGFLLGTGQVAQKTVYVCAIDRTEKPDRDFPGIARMNSFLNRIFEDPHPLIVLLDIPRTHDASQKSPFPEDPEKMLADRHGVGGWYYILSRLSGKVPLAAAVFERMGAALTFPVALCDCSAMVKDAGMSIGRLDVVKGILREDTGYEALGGAGMHAEISGSVDWVEETETEVLDRIKAYLSYLPSKSGDPLLRQASAGSSAEKDVSCFIPAQPLKAMDMDALVAAISDDNSVMELRQAYAREMITALASFNGHVAGVIANRSQVRGGLLFPETCQKTSRFISLCNAFGIPLVFLSDAPGFMVGSHVEQQGSIKQGAHLFQTIANASTARLAVVVRRSYTAGLFAMAGGGMHPDRFVALPSAVISIYGEAVARQLMTDASESQTQRADQMLQSARDPEFFLANGMLDAIIPFEGLRQEIIQFVSRYQDGERASRQPIPAI